jgi:hypothetical protein
VLAQNLQRESQEKANLLLRLREEVERRGRLRDAMRQKNYHLGGTLKVNGATSLGSIRQGGWRCSTGGFADLWQIQDHE